MNPIQVLASREDRWRVAATRRSSHSGYPVIVVKRLLAYRAAWPTRVGVGCTRMVFL